MFRPMFDRALQQALNQRGMGDAEVFVETLESNRFPGNKQSTLFKHYLGEKYANRKIDVVIAVWDRALNYALENQDELFPDAALASVVTRPRTFPRENQVAQVTAGDKVLATVTLALKLHPNTRKIFVVDGTLQSNDDVQLEFARQLAPLAPRISVEFLRNLPIADLLERVKALPDDSLVLFARQTMRSRTQSMTQMEAIDQVVGASRVPVYVGSDQLLGHGAVGGVVFKTEALGRTGADSATKLIMARPREFSPFVKPAPCPPWTGDSSRSGTSISTCCLPGLTSSSASTRSGSRTGLTSSPPWWCFSFRAC